MQVKDMKQKSVGVHDFAMNPRADIPRSSFPIRQGVKTAFSASYLVPIQVLEALPGDTFNVTLDAVVRTAIPIVPVLDNWHMEFFAFFMPNRLTWANWQKMLGAQDNPADSISYTVPQVVTNTGGFPVGSVYDFMGLPVVGQVTAGQTVTQSALPLRAYNRIYNDWFKDQNLINNATVNTGDGTDSNGIYTLQLRGKRHDYFTACLPWPQKGTAITLPLGSTANVKTNAADLVTGAQSGIRILLSTGAGPAANQTLGSGAAGNVPNVSTTASVGTVNAWYPSNLYADLTTATGPTVNLFRQYFQTQKYMERQARGGTRYTEIIQSHFGVRPPDFRLDRPEYIGGGKINILINAIPQTSATGLTGGTTPAGNLTATGYGQGRCGYSYSCQEHGYIIVIANVRADLTYSQGLERHWSRTTVFDFYFPVFAMLGEQAVLNKELYVKGDGNDALVFGYIPRWDEYRHFPSKITGLLRPTAAGNIAYWHSSQLFGALPTLNSTFIQDDTHTVLQRNFTGGAATEGQQFICDFMFTGRIARPMPMNSIPGLIDHF